MKDNKKTKRLLPVEFCHTPKSKVFGLVSCIEHVTRSLSVSLTVSVYSKTSPFSFSATFMGDVGSVNKGAWFLNKYIYVYKEKSYKKT